MDKSIAQIFYDKLGSAIDADQLSCIADVLAFLAANGAVKQGVLLSDIEPMTIRFSDMSTLQIDMNEEPEFFDIDIKHGYFVPYTKH